MGRFITLDVLRDVLLCPPGLLLFIRLLLICKIINVSNFSFVLLAKTGVCPLPATAESTTLCVLDTLGAYFNQISVAVIQSIL